jgi:predicted AlkP superfamily pyrophosphatase or phosphodiesterase
MPLILLALIVGAVVIGIVVSRMPKTVKDPPHTLILISIDGFRWDYLEMYNYVSPNLNRYDKILNLMLFRYFFSYSLIKLYLHCSLKPLNE